MISLHFRAMRQNNKYQLLIFIILAHEFQETLMIFIDLLLVLYLLLYSLRTTF